jgi:copper(I)-binding protein
MGSMFLRASLIFSCFLTMGMVSAAAPPTDQRTVRVSDGWITSENPTDATAGAVIENGTMYDIYIVGAETEAAGIVELVQVASGKSTTVKEVAVAAFDRLEMSTKSTFLRLTQLKQPLKSGDRVTIVLRTDAGDRLSVVAAVK